MIPGKFKPFVSRPTFPKTYGKRNRNQTVSNDSRSQARVEKALAKISALYVTATVGEIAKTAYSSAFANVPMRNL